MDTEKPLKMATCTKCSLKFFVSEPRSGLFGASQVRTHDTRPSDTKNREIVPFNCPRCDHLQFVEFYYGL